MIAPGIRNPSFRRGMIVILALYTVLAFLYLRATPPMEASDEGGHMAFIYYLQQHRALPVSRLEGPHPIRTQEFTQPPLYYLLGALLASPIDTTGYERHYRQRPGAPVGRADLPGPKNAFIPHGRTRYPYARPIRALMLVRLFSLLLGAGTVLSIGMSVRALTPDRPENGWWAAALTAFNPMFLFISSSVNNDNLSTFLVTAAMTWIILRGPRIVEPRAALVLGALAGLAVSAKASAMILAPVLAWTMFRAPGSRAHRARALAIAAGMMALLSGPWMIRNTLLYGDPLGTAMHMALAGNGRATFQPLALLREWDGFIKSYWGVFGAFNVIYRDGVYFAFFAVTALGLAAGLAWLLRRPRPWDPRLESLCALALCNVLAVAAWTSRLMGSQGRLLFPSLLAWNGLWVLSLSGRGRAWETVVKAGVVLFLLAMAAWGALFVIPPQYS